ncbi:nephrin [Scleropages formosus]|uniref:nephrin n=1 Tax=Scleropages formosus TaxID=113540 RepID=UPI0010FA9A7D|nr:nephrin [Scleropages formosus]
MPTLPLHVTLIADNKPHLPPCSTFPGRPLSSVTGCGRKGYSAPITWYGEVHSQQAFKTQPKNVTVKVGSTVVLKCAVLRLSGTVQWVKDGLLLGPDRTLPGFPRYSMVGNEKKGEYHLQIENVALEDDAPYECQAGPSESSQPIVSHSIWINVMIPPSSPIIEVETEEPWVAGQEYIVTCTAPDAKPAAEVTLFKDGTEFTEVESVTMPGSDMKLQNTKAMVKFTAQSWDNGREVVCWAKNPVLAQPLETSLVMNVYFPSQPPVLQGLEKDEVTAGTTLKLVCTSHGGNPLATLHWTKNGEVVSTSWEVDKLSQKASSILIMPVKPEDNQAVLCCESVNQVSRRPFVLSRTLTVLFEPAKINVLGSFEAVEGKEVNLCCYTTSSNPPVHIRWWLGSRELNQTVVTYNEGEHGGKVTMSNLTHTVFREENDLPLTCEAFNNGTRYSKTKTSPLQVFYPPQKVWIDGPPKGVPLRAGATVRLVCFSAGGNKIGRITWLKDGKSVWDVQKPVVSEKGVSRELILVLQPSDNMATYRCDATNEAKKVRSAQTKLHVQFPAISVKIVPKEKEVRRGQTLIMECIAGSSNPKTNISWSLGTEKLKGVDQAPKKAEYGGVSVRSNLSLQLSSQHNGVRVICQAYSDLLSEGASTFYTLNVLYPPEFSPDQPEGVQAVEDDVVHLPLMVSANPDDVTCVWIFQGEELVKERDPRYHWRDGLEIWNVTRKDAGKYNIRCENAEGEERTAVTLDVQYAPSVRIETDPVYVDLGQTADLVCKADANPVSSGMFSWERVGEDEDEDPGSQTEDENISWLTIPEVTRSHSGRYKCTVDNGIAPAASTEVQLIVRFKPELQKGPHWSKVASRGDGSSIAQVVCQAEGIPKVEFSWTKNGIKIDFNNPRYSEKMVKEGWVHTSTLTIVNVSAALDYAIFTCIARNTLGEDRLDIQLLSTNHPDPPSDLRLASVTHHTVTLQWNAGFDGGLQQKFRIRYRRPASTSFLYVDVFPPMATSFTVDGLSPKTTYNFSVNAINSMGESEYADNNAVLTVTTKEWQPTEEEQPEDGHGTTDPLRMPLHWAITLAAAGGLLLVLNASGCFLALRWKRRRSLSEETNSISKAKESEGTRSVSAESNRYEGREPVNVAARRTLLVDSASEPESTTYESYGDEGSQHYYFPTGHYHPSLYPHPEGAERHVQDGLYSMVPEVHDYEEVRDWRMYEDVGELSLPPPPSLYYPPLPELHTSWRQAPTLHAPHERRGEVMTDLEPRIKVYDAVMENYLSRQDGELPFELRGELV